jgi:hypothetical protein
MAIDMRAFLKLGYRFFGHIFHGENHEALLLKLGTHHFQTNQFPWVD